MTTFATMVLLLVGPATALAGADVDPTRDSDGDALTDIDELDLGTDPNDPDTDDDRMPDGWEVANGLDPLGDGRAADSDGDALLDPSEFVNATDPGDPDTDDDGMPDGWEVINGFDPLIDDGRSDRDGGGASNRAEFDAGTDPDDRSDDREALDDPARDSGATIEGSVFVDVDRDGRVDPTERELSGVRIELIRDGAVIASTTTASPFRFTDVADGPYTIRVDGGSLPSGLHSTGSGSAAVVVGGAPVEGIAFGANYARITGTILDRGGQPVSGASVEVVDRAGSSFATTTGDDGHYSVEGSDQQIMVLGAATVRVELDGRWESTSVDVASGASTEANVSVPPAADEVPVAAIDAQPAADAEAALPPVLALTGSDHVGLIAGGLLSLLLGVAFVRLSNHERVRLPAT